MQYNIKKYPDIPKKVFVENFIKQSDAQSHSNPSAIFMAGLPGAGKTEFSENLIKLVDNTSTKAVRIDMDEIARQIKGYRPEIADEYRESATRLMNGIYDKVLKEKIEFIMDGTFGSKSSIRNIERAINHGYIVKIVYIIQDPKLAWEFTLAREKVEHRSINMDGFVKTYFNITDNILKVSSLMKKYDKITVDIVIKNKENGIESWIPNVRSGIDILLKTSYNNKTLKEYLND
jgi:predicted ABC-type ATPase